jgi:hypothetical protein
VEWTTQAWRDTALDWAAIQGFEATGEVTQPRLCAWSTALRIPTAEGLVWLKAGCAGTAYEAGLLEALSGYGAPHLLHPLAVDRDRGWLLLPDGGPTLRTALDRYPDLAVWEQVLPKYAALQRSVEGRELPGADDHSPARLPAVLSSLLESLEVGPVEELRALQPRFESWCEELAHSSIVPTVQHDDLHDNNVFANQVFFDWGDAVLAHPFSSLLVTLRSIAQRWSLEPGAQELARLRDCYLEAWSEGHSRVELELQSLLAVRVAKVSRSAAWVRALAGVEDAGQHAEAAPAWLEELLEPDDF